MAARIFSKIKTMVGKNLPSAYAALVLSWLEAGVNMATIHRSLAVFTFTGVNMFTGSEAREKRARLREKTPLDHWRSRLYCPAPAKKTEDLIKGAL